MSLQVLVGFIATALLTFGAIILGYLTDSLPEEYLTDLDHRFIERVARSWMGRTSVKAWKRFIRICRKCLFLKPPREEDSLDYGQRQEALKKFILTLSDQQLVTGVAMLVAGFANWCTMSVYELNMIVVLAWFSSATHLATLDVLQDYFRQNRVVRNWRMIGMLAIVLLLIAGLLVTGFYANYFLTAPLPCLKSLASARAYNCNGTAYYSTNHTVIPFNSTFIDNGTHYAKCYRSYMDIVSRGFNIFSILGSLFTIAYLVYGYTSAILRTISTSPNNNLTLSNVALYALFRGILARKKNVSIEMIENAFLDTKAARDKGFEKRLAKMHNNYPAQLFIKYSAYSNSFLYHIGGLFFGLSYGVSQVVVVRWTSERPELQAGGNRIDFGQIVTLVLLVLPLLAAVEIFHGTSPSRFELEKY